MFVGPIETATAELPKVRASSMQLAAGLLILIALVPWLLARLMGFFIMRDIKFMGRCARVLGEELGAARR